MKTLINKRLYIVLPILCGLVFLLFIVKLDAFATRSWRYAWNLGHIPLFTLIGYVFYRVNTDIQKKNILTQVLILALTGFLLGLGIEVLQSFVNRSASMQDLMLDIVGAVMAVPLFSTKLRLLRGSHRALIYFMSVVLLVLISWRLVEAILDEYHAGRQFPVLSDFEHPRQLGRWLGDAKREIVNNIHMGGSNSLKVSLQKKHYSGVELMYFPADWSEYDVFSFQVLNPNTSSVFLILSIYDIQHIKNKFTFRDRYTNKLSLKPGWNKINISLDDLMHAPKKRLMDISNIYGVRMYMVKPTKGQHFYIDDVQLEK